MPSGLISINGKKAERFGNEVVVLEKPSSARFMTTFITNTALAFFLLFDPPTPDKHTVYIVNCYRKQHQDDKNGLAPAVENKVCYKKYRIAPSDREI